MTAVFRTLCRNRRVWHVAVAATVILTVVIAGAFLTSTDAAKPEPVPFGDTTSTGLGGEDRQVIASQDLTLPRAQVFYSQYSYIAGYRGIEHAVSDLQGSDHRQQFGYPIAVYVSDLSGTDVRVTEEGYLDTDTSPGWIDAERAYFVVESDAETSAGDTVVSFGSREEAESFSTEYGGTVLDWDELQAHEFEIDGPAAVRDRVSTQREAADDRVAELRPLAGREGSTVVVGEDAPTIQAAIDNASNNATVVVPAGTYDEKPVVDRPLTIRGEGARIRGDGNGSVLEIESDDVAITGVEITGVGNRTDADDDQIDDEQWDRNIESGYGYGDAGISATDVENVYISDVFIETPANGILLRDTNRSVVEGLRVEGSDEWIDGFMGVMAMRSPVVVQNSTFAGGRDGIYLHRSHDTVIRNNSFSDSRFGVHFMYTSDSLVVDNVARDHESAGITIMTDPARNAVTGNEVYNSSSGILPSGSHHYIADNVLAYNGRGLATSGSQTLYERNVIYGNELGIRASSIHPTSQVIENDVVENDVPVEAGTGPLRFYTHEGVGNYWDAAMGGPDGPPESYSPTDPIEGQFHRTDGAMMLAASPAVRALDALRDTTPGMRDGAVIDTAPLSEPVQPEIIATLETMTGDSPLDTSTNRDRPAAVTATDSETAEIYDESDETHGETAEINDKSDETNGETDEINDESDETHGETG